MKPIGPEIVCYWIAAVLYGVAAVLYIIAIFKKKEKIADLAMKIVWAGVFAHTWNFFLPAIRHNYTGI